MTSYWRPLVETLASPLAETAPLAGGWARFAFAERLERGRAPERVPLRDVPAAVLERLTSPRAEIAGIACDRPRIMGILNVTPDSFSDGGRFGDLGSMIARGIEIEANGAAILDLGGESTRPGADAVPAIEEIARTAIVIAGVTDRIAIPMSIDTRKVGVAEAALSAGATIVNDVSGLVYDPGMLDFVAERGVPVCITHARGTPRTMQDNTQYDDVLLDVYDELEAAIARAEASGVPRSNIFADIGIGFAKTAEHNITLLQGISLFHALGCPLLLGVSRKGFIRVYGNVPEPTDRMPGTVAVSIWAASQGVQFHRVHDISAHKQAFDLYWAIMGR